MPEEEIKKAAAAHLLLGELSKYLMTFVWFLNITSTTCLPFEPCQYGLMVKLGSHSHDFTGDHRRLDSRGVVAGWTAAWLSIVAGVVVCGLLWSPGLS